MEFANLGSHCNVALCRQKDFLPFKCDACRAIFCLEHRSYLAHECSHATDRDHRVVICPLCAQSVHFRGTADENVYAVFEDHQRLNCEPESRVKKVRCIAPNCKELLTLSNRTTCSKCRQEVCLRHRHEDAHACPCALPVKESFLASMTRHALGMGSPASVSAVRAGAGAAKKTVGAGGRGQSAGARASQATPQQLLRETAHRRQQGGGGGGGAQAGAEAEESCPHCPARFNDAVALVRHVESSHTHTSAGEEGGPSRCPQCGKVEDSIHALILHVERQHPVGSGSGAGAWPITATTSPTRSASDDSSCRIS